MPQNRSYDLRDIAIGHEPEQSRSLLAQAAVDNDEDALTPPHQPPPIPHSSFSRIDSNGGPRVPRIIDRVRFDVGEPHSGEHARTPSREDEAEDDFFRDMSENRGSDAGHRAPLLTHVEAPSVMVAQDLDFNSEGLLENARPKSGIT